MTVLPRQFLQAVALLLVAAALAGCRNSDGKAESGLRVVEVKVGSKQLTLEVADTPDARQTGLMRRDSMPADRGMLFVFPTEESLGFYMKNTRIPLDIVYIDAVGQVVSIHTMKPYDLSTTRSAGPAKYAIEVNAGIAKASGVKVGDLITIPDDARDTKQ
jgi:uncharacterized membrane protein (UPF0127 family)